MAEESGDPPGTTSGIGETAAEGSSSTGDPLEGALRVFVSRDTWEGDMDGIFGADELCQNSADAAELGGTWRTYLATSGSEPWEGIYGEGPWVDLAGTVLFNNEAGLTLDPIAPLAIDQFGDGVSGFVWIGSEQDNCQNWTALQEGVELYYGALGCAWGQSVDGWNQSGTTFCGDSARLYCFELGE